MNKILAIIGAGHLGRQIAYHAITDNHFDTVVFFDDYNQNEIVDGCKLIGNSESVMDFYNKECFTHLIIGVGYKHMQARSNLFERFKGKIPFANIIHSTCLVDTSAKIGEGVVLYPGSIIDANVIIRDNVLINIGCVIAHDTTVDAHCFLSPSVNLAGFINVGEKSILGINCTVIDNINIRSSTQIGAGGVVVKNINKNGLYVGNPVRFVR